MWAAGHQIPRRTGARIAPVLWLEKSFLWSTHAAVAPLGSGKHRATKKSGRAASGSAILSLFAEAKTEIPGT